MTTDITFLGSQMETRQHLLKQTREHRKQKDEASMIHVAPAPYSKPTELQPQGHYNMESQQPGFGPPPSQHYPYHHMPPTSQTTVILQQPTQVSVPKARTWSTSTCGCFEDIPSCLLGWCCLPCFECYLSMRMGESCCVPICVPGGMIALRTKLRTEQGIAGSICDDCCSYGCCTPCIVCQLARELNYIEATGL